MDAIGIDDIPMGKRKEAMRKMAESSPNLSPLGDALDIWEATAPWGTKEKPIRQILEKAMMANQLPILQQFFLVVSSKLGEGKSLAEVLSDEGMDDEADMVTSGALVPGIGSQVPAGAELEQFGGEQLQHTVSEAAGAMLAGAAAISSILNLVLNRWRCSTAS